MLLECFVQWSATSTNLSDESETLKMWYFTSQVACALFCARVLGSKRVKKNARIKLSKAWVLNSS